MEEKMTMYRTLAGFSLIVVIALASSCTARESDPPKITVEKLHELMLSKKPPLVLEVRTEPELTGELGVLVGVVHIPLQELSTRMNELEKFKKKDVYVICRSGNRSGTAAAMLREKGFNAFNVEGGMRAWRAKYGNANK